jgi:hypothetical protein
VLGCVSAMPLSFLQPTISETPPLHPVLSQAAVALLLNGQVIEAIKQVRLEQNIGLNEAKDVIETFLQSQPALQKRIDEADAREGLLRWLIFLVIGGGGLAYFLT